MVIAAHVVCTRAFLCEIATNFSKTSTQRQLLQLLNIVDYGDLTEICKVCLGPNCANVRNGSPHICNWNCIDSVYLAEVEEAGAITASDFFRRYRPSSTSKNINLLRRLIELVQDETYTVPEIFRYARENVWVGELILNAWNNALMTENLAHLLDIPLKSVPCRDVSQRGGWLTVMGNQQFKTLCLSSDCRRYKTSEFCIAPSRDVECLAKIPGDVMCDNKIVRILTAHCLGSLSRKIQSLHQDRIMVALSCVVGQLPSLLGTDIHIVGSTGALYYRWSFYSDVRQINLLPSFFLSRAALPLLRKLKDRGLLLNVQWCASKGSPSDVAINLITSSL